MMNIIERSVFIAYTLLIEILNEEDDEVEVKEKTFNFAEFTVHQFSNNQFKEHFRIHPSTFEILLQQIRMANNDFNDGYVGRPQVNFEKQLLITLWCLANIESFRYDILFVFIFEKLGVFLIFFRSVADRFGITKSACWRILYRTCFRILKVNTQLGIISFPMGNKTEEIINGFKAINGFPGMHQTD